MITNKITIDKIVKAVELICPMLKQKLVTEAYIVGSVAKGSSREDSDIDIYLINPLFKLQFNTHKIDISPSQKNNVYIKKLVYKLGELNAEPHYISESKIMDKIWFWRYKNEIFHFMYDYESESIKKAGEYIEITEELCNQINELD